MSLRRRIPLVALQRSVYALLTEYAIKIDGKHVQIYDDIPRKAVAPPFITFGDFSYNTGAGKVTEMGDATLEIHIWSKYQGKKEVNEIADDLCQILTSVRLDLCDDGFRTTEQDVSMVEAFEADKYGYHGVLSLRVKIQNIGG